MSRFYLAGHLPAMTSGILLSFSSLAAQAGGLGSIGTADAEVKSGRTTAGIFCPALDATVPQSLASQIDCDDEGTAQPAVADNRIENRGLFGFLPASGPIRDFEDSEDNEDDPQPVARNDPAPAPQAEPEPAPEPEPEPEPEEEVPPAMDMNGGD